MVTGKRSAKKLATKAPRVDRARIVALEDLPNVGKAIAADFRRIGIPAPGALVGRDPYALYHDLQHVTGQRHDPCVLDTFIAAVRFMEGAPARPWWHYTAERKKTLAAAAAMPPAAARPAAPPGRRPPAPAVKRATAATRRRPRSTHPD